MAEKTSVCSQWSSVAGPSPKFFLCRKKGLCLAVECYRMLQSNPHIYNNSSLRTAVSGGPGRYRPCTVRVRKFLVQCSTCVTPKHWRFVGVLFTLGVYIYFCRNICFRSVVLPIATRRARLSILIVFYLFIYLRYVRVR